MGKATNLLAGFSAGAAFMYMTDPDRGRRRRALIRDKAARTVHETQRAVDKTGRDISNRVHGLAAMARAVWGDRYVEDDVIVARVRAKIGRVVSHPHAIHVRSERGRLILEGPVLAREYHALLSAAESAAEGMEIGNRLERHAEADIPLFRAARRAPANARRSCRPTGRRRFGRWQDWEERSCWSAASNRAVFVAPPRASSGAECCSAPPRTWNSGARSASTSARAVNLEKTVNIHAPVPDVFAFWSHYANFPRFMSHLRQVRDLGNNRSLWTAEGPLGIPVTWSAEVTERVENKLIAWRSLPGAYLENSGVVRFDPNPDGGTRITIRMSYTPPVGVIGHAVAWLFGVDPKRDMDDDLVRLKSLIEHGKTRAHGGIVHREQLGAPSPL